MREGFAVEKQTRHEMGFDGNPSASTSGVRFDIVVGRRSVEGERDGRAIVRGRAVVVERGRPRATEARGGEDGERAHDGG